MTDNISPENNNNAFQGKTIEGYKILKPLGQGKFSTVYKAEVVKDNKIVALKKIKVMKIIKVYRYST
jgi:serine/threonine protein kinase